MASPPPEPVFRLGDSGLYWLVGSDQRAGFRAGQAAGDELTLSQSFADAGGVWFFLDRAPDDEAAFAAALTSWLELQPPARGPRALWLAQAELGPLRWRATALGLDRRAGETLVRAATVFDLGGLQLQASAGSAVSVAWNQELQGWGLALHGDAPLSLIVAGGRFPASPGLASLCFDTGYAGCLAWSFSLASPVAGEPTDLERLGVSLRFFAPDAEADDGTVRVLQVGVLRQTAAYPLHATVDPIAALDGRRTRLALFPPGSGAPVTAFASSFVTARGYGVSLGPVPPTDPGALPPGFVLGVQPLVVGEPGRVPAVHYFVPDGDFVPAAPGAPSGSLVEQGVPAPALRVLCGMNGTEYLGLPSDGALLQFRAGGPAFVPDPESRADVLRSGEAEEGALARDESDGPLGALSELGSTAWLWAQATGTGSIAYYAQPQDGSLYRQQGDGPELSYAETAVGLLPASSPGLAFPMLGYAGLDSADIRLAKELEARGLAPERNQRLSAALADDAAGDARGAGPRLAEADAGDAPHAPCITRKGVDIATTPGGLAIGTTNAGADWAWLAIGNTGSRDDGLPDLYFTDVRGPFRQALLSDRVFLVLGDAETVLQSASVAYQLTQTDLGLIQALPDEGGVSQATFAAVAATVQANGYRCYRTEAVFDAMLEGAAPQITDEEILVFQRYGGLLSPVIGDWTFRMSPRNWVGPGQHARLIFKFQGDRSVRELVDDLPAWSWPEAAASAELGGAAHVQRELRAIIREAEQAAFLAEQAGESSAYARFVATVNDPLWTGVLALSVDVPTGTLPEALQPLAAGLQPLFFVGHHLGLASTGMSPNGSGRLDADVTPSFGLIDYDDPIDQVSTDAVFAFKVQQLRVGFENGLPASFRSSVQLLVNRLFGARTRLQPTAHGNNLILDGVYQAELADGSGARGSYAFTQRTPAAMQLSSGQLRQVAIDSVLLSVPQASQPASGDTVVQAVFQLAGRLRFAAADGEFDPFCWGPPEGAVGELKGQGNPRDEEGDGPSLTERADWRGLLFSNYAITMRFSPAKPWDVQFSVADDNLTLDSAHSPARADSLFARFPLSLVGLLTTPDPAVTGGDPSTRTPEDAGFVSISAPIQQAALSQPWYGLVYEVDLGSLGALAGSAGLSLRLLAAWSPGGEDDLPGVYVGAALPGVEHATGMNLPLQGILHLGVRAVQFKTYADEEGTQYLMRLRDFGVQVLGLSFPPGHNDITLFGNPDQTSNTKLGWYAAYASGTAGGKAGAQGGAARRSRSIRGARPARLHGSLREEG